MSEQTRNRVRPSGDRRVLVIFGNIPLLGQERGNIQAMNAVKAAGMDTLFVTHNEYGHEVIQPTLDDFGHAWTVATYPGLLSRGMSLGEWRKRLTSIVRGMREFLQIARAYEPTHIHACNSSHFLGLLPALWLLRVPVVYRLGDAPQQHRPLFRFIWRFLIAPRVDRFVCISKFIQDLIIEAGADPDQTRVIYSYPPDRPAPKAENLPEAQRGRTILYMGQLSEEKGVGLLVKAAIKLCTEREDLRFLVAGDYTWQNPYAEALIKCIADLGLSQRVQFLGYVDDIPALLAQTDVHVCPSICQEALGNVVLEAKQAGVPSVVFPSGGLPELVVEQGRDGFVCAERSAESLEAGLRHYLDMDEEELAAAKVVARRSLPELGITREAFNEAWEAVYASV